MRARLRASVAVAGLVAMAACGSEPGTLIITLDFVPDVVATNSVTLSGTVMRTPPKNTTITISAQGGQVAVTDTADADGVFSLSVQLLNNRENTIELVAADQDGSTSVPEMITLVHDDRGPSVVSMTPANKTDGAPTSGDVMIMFDEAVVLGPSAAVTLVTVGQTISGVTTQSSDSLTLTFVPQSARRTNAVYELHFDDVTDRAGNVVGADQACFVTILEDPSLAVSDPANDFLLSTPSPADVVGVRLSVVQGMLTGVFEFTMARAYDTTAANNVLAIIEIDIDQDATTGVRSIRDSVLSGAPDVGPSDLQVEYLIGIDPYSLDGPSYLGSYVDYASFDVLEQFTPAFCGGFVGFHTEVASFDGDDGNFAFTVLALNFQDSTGVTLDPAPNDGHYTAAFAGLFVSPPYARTPRGSEQLRRFAVPSIPVPLGRP